ncbi:ABC transporter permease [Candidatus Gracilibacteria bacterium]|nr:ABC transporter permease [Candidatus Gracilibacteria bacterium]
MRFLKYFLYAIKILWKNKLRTSLSTLGIVIGIASVTIMLALGEGLKKQMLENLSVSNDVITITPNEGGNWGEVGTPGIGKMQTGDSETPTSQPTIRVKEIFTQDTIDKIKKYVPNVKTVLATGNAYGGETNFEGKTIYSSIVGVTYDYFKTKNIKVVSGYGFTTKDFKNNAKVAILGNDLVKYDLEGKNPIGKTIMLGGYAYTVIGILDKSNDWNVNYAISIPMTTLQSSFGVSKFQNLAIYVKDILKIEDTKKNVLYLLFKLSEVFSPSEVKFRLESNDEAIKYIDETVKQMKLFLVGIASIALLVGGIGIMNIMFVSVVERTKEIGIRKAIGAKRKDILMQFLAESVVISILGCILALGVSLIGIYFINKYSPMPAVFSINVLLTASLVSVSMGIIFGIVPAWKASKLRPIDALRFE